MREAEFTAVGVGGNTTHIHSSELMIQINNTTSLTRRDRDTLTLSCHWSYLRHLKPELPSVRVTDFNGWKNISV